MESGLRCCSNDIQDPREYLPFLRKLQQLPDLRRQFEIDSYLGRWTKALRHLHALNAHDELRAYAIKHVLYKDAIDLYKYQQEQLYDITHLYADYLYDQSKYKEAGIGMSLLTVPFKHKSELSDANKHQLTNPFLSTPMLTNVTSWLISGENHCTAQ
jgi:hypothetical protein